MVAAHVQAWEVTVDELDPVRRAVLEEPDPVQRIRLGLDHRRRRTDARPARDHRPLRPADRRPSPRPRHRRSPGRSADHDLTPAAWSPLADWGGRALRPGTHIAQDGPGPRLEAWRRASARLADTNRSPLAPLQRAVLNACGPELLAGVDIDELAASVERQCRLFEVRG